MGKNHKSESLLRCPICHSLKRKVELYPGTILRENLIPIVKNQSSEWSQEQQICSSCLRKARLKLVENMLLEDKGKFGEAEKEVLRSIENQSIITQASDAKEKITFGENLSDRIAEIGGSWSFIIGFMILLAFWIILNTLILLRKPFDPYPYILLNLLLSCLAALQAPIIMMSQNRKEEKDRLRAESDYKTNLKAELEIRHMNIKMDLLLTHQWQHLLDLQQMQLDILEDMNGSDHR